MKEGEGRANHGQGGVSFLGTLCRVLIGAVRPRSES